MCCYNPNVFKYFDNYFIMAEALPGLVFNTFTHFTLGRGHRFQQPAKEVHSTRGKNPAPGSLAPALKALCSHQAHHL